MGAGPITGKYLLGKMDTQIFANLTNKAEVAGKKTQFQCRRSSVGDGLVENVFPDTEGFVPVRTANSTYQ